MVSCASCGCSLTANSKDCGVTFHSFPKNEKRRQKWIDFLKKPEFILRKSSVLCSHHFAENCFDRTSRLKVRLFPNAIPTIAVDRLKYVRTFNPMVTSSVIDVEMEDESQSPDTLPSTSSQQDSFPPPTETAFEELEETPRERNLKRRIHELERMNSMKTRKIHKLHTIIWRQKRRISSLRAMTMELKEKNLLFEEQENVILDHFGRNKEFIQRLMNKSQNKMVRKPFEQSLRAFAVTLHFFSPKAYCYVRQKFENCLPHPKTLSKWYSSINAKPGFTSEAFDFLKLKVQNSNKKIICSLIFDEMAIRKHLEYAGNEYYGYVNCGGDLFGDSMDLANEALVFMLVCINEPWKLPIGYFFIAGINSQQKASLTKHALMLLQDVGVTVSNITFDGCIANFSMCNILNCYFSQNNISADFTYENCKYFLLPDPVHMIKLVRNCFGEKKRFVNNDGEVIDFDYVEKLNILQEREGLHLGNKLRKQHIQFFKQKMKVKLATQLLSRSVSEALIFCKNELHLKEFANCSATAKFIRAINDTFDVLNSHKISDFNFKQAACKKNIESIRLFYNEIHEYFDNLKFTDGTLVLKSQRKTGFLGLLVGLKAVLGMYDEYVAKGDLTFIPTYKLNQDHIELFFGTIRSQGGYNNNPTCRQFTAAYKKILIHSEVREGGAGNCIPLEDINILNVSSRTKPPEQIINESVMNGLEINDSQEDHIIDSFMNDHTYALSYDYLSPYSSAVVTYISGFVSFKLGKKLKCEHCVSQLFGEKEDFFNSLIEYKSRGGLSYPSADVVKICELTEKFLKNAEGCRKKIVKEEIALKVLKYFIGKKIFENMTAHDMSPIENHKVLLIKSISNCYLTTRINYICKNSVSDERIRSFHTKLILFKGQ